jgi:hypothetical protein
MRIEIAPVCAVALKPRVVIGDAVPHSSVNHIIIIIVVGRQQRVHVQSDADEMLAHHVNARKFVNYFHIQ